MRKKCFFSNLSMYEEGRHPVIFTSSPEQRDHTLKKPSIKFRLRSEDMGNLAYSSCLLIMTALWSVMLHIGINAKQRNGPNKMSLLRGIRLSDNIIKAQYWSQLSAGSSRTSFRAHWHGHHEWFALRHLITNLRNSALTEGFWNNFLKEISQELRIG